MGNCLKKPSGEKLLQLDKKFKIDKGSKGKGSLYDSETDGTDGTAIYTEHWPRPPLQPRLPRSERPRGPMTPPM